MVVDDSAIARRVIGDALSLDPEVEIVASAPDGEVALRKLEAFALDVVTLDVDMPGMSGLDTLTHIRRSHPDLPVIMITCGGERTSRLALEAMSRGASDYVTKPSGQVSREEATASLASTLLPVMRALVEHRRKSRLAPPSLTAAERRSPAAGRAQVVAIAASTGGPAALEEFLRALPDTFSLPVVIVQHMPKTFTRALAERLDRACRLRVQEAEAGVLLTSGAWIAPGDHHLTVAREGPWVRLALDQGPPVHSCRPAADPLFLSVAETFGAHAVALVMTGIGADGTRGSRAIREAGGVILAQDEASSVVWGMPGSVVQEGLADHQGDPVSMAQRVAELIQ